VKHKRKEDVLQSATLAILVALASAPEGLTLEEAIGEALGNRSEIVSAEMALRSARLTELSSDLWFMPSISASGNIAASENVESTSHLYSSGVILDGAAALFSLQGVASSRSASTATELSRLSLSTTEMDVIREVTLAYLGVLHAQETLETMRLKLEVQEETYRTASLNYEAGTISRYSYLQSHVILENSRPEYNAAEYSLEEAYEALAVALGVDRASIGTLSGSLEEGIPFSVPETLEEASELLDKWSPDLLLSSLSVQSAQNAIFYAYAAFAPTLSATASWGLSGLDDEFGEVDTGDWDESWNVGLRITVPIMTGLSSYTSSRSARYDELAAESSREADRAGLHQQLNQAWNDYELAMANLSGANALVEEAEEALQIAMTSYESGSITSLDLDNSTVALMQARNTRSGALYSLRSGEAIISRLIGSTAAYGKDR
jgi:outer membrane protein